MSVGVKNEQKLESLNDDFMIDMIHHGDNEALNILISRYKHYVRAKARKYFIVGADREDIIQEGMIGLFKAIRDYDGEKLTSFKGFAELCVNRQIITAIKTATRQKHTPLNSYVSLDRPIYDEESDRTLMDIMSSPQNADPQEMLLNRERIKEVELKLSELLSVLEKEVLRLYMDGSSYQDISAKLKRHVKSIDNALQRIKRKLEDLLKTHGTGAV